MNSTSPTVSVVIPCYNAEAFLHETISSVLQQTHKPMEVLIVDDGSTDNSAAIAESFGGVVRVLRQPNQGESVARNRGIEESKGEWIAFLDADDLWKPEKLEMQLAVAAPETVAVHTNFYLLGDKEGCSQAECDPADQRYTARRLAVKNCILTSSLVVRRDICPLFPTWTKYAEDLVFNVELSQRGSIELACEALTGYRIHVANQSKSALMTLKKFGTIRRWLASSAPHFSQDDMNVIYEAWLERLCRAANNAKYRRQWPDFHEYRRCLAEFRGVACVDEFFDIRIYPAWVYHLKDRIWRLLRPGTSFARTETSVDT
jgi:glycosyltransferase involved in cell wall biosynthesis